MSKKIVQNIKKVAFCKNYRENEENTLNVTGQSFINCGWWFVDTSQYQSQYKCQIKGFCFRRLISLLSVIYNGIISVVDIWNDKYFTIFMWF